MDATSIALPLITAARPWAAAEPHIEPPTAAPAATMGQTFITCAASLHRFVHVRAGGDPHLVDDIMQQLWFAASRGPSLPADQAEAWLRGAAKNIIATHWRKLGRRAAAAPLVDARLANQLADQLTSQAAPVSLLQAIEAKQQLLLALTDLPSAEQDLLARHYFAGQPQALLASDLGVSERAVEGRLYRARQALRQKLACLE